MKINENTQVMPLYWEYKAATCLDFLRMLFVVPILPRIETVEMRLWHTSQNRIKYSVRISTHSMNNCSFPFIAQRCNLSTNHFRFNRSNKIKCRHKTTQQQQPKMRFSVFITTDLEKSFASTFSVFHFLILYVSWQIRSYLLCVVVITFKMCPNFIYWNQSNYYGQTRLKIVSHKSVKFYITLTDKHRKWDCNHNKYALNKTNTKNKRINAVICCGL